MWAYLIKKLILGAGWLQDGSLAVRALSSPLTVLTQAASWWSLSTAHRIGCTKISPIVIVFPWVEVLFLKSFHVNARTEFQWWHAAYTVICLVKRICANSCLSENLHFIRTWAANLFSYRSYLGLRIRFCCHSLLRVLFGRCLLNRLSRSTLQGSCSDYHLWKRFLRCDSL